MLAQTIKWKYDEIINHCSKMTTAGNQLEGSFNNLKSALNALSTWEGSDATAFKAAMNDTILPALQNEAKFMKDVAATLKKMAERQKAAEEARSRSSNLKDGLSSIASRLR